MLYDLAKQIDRERFKRRCNSLFKNNKVVELTERTQRTNSQNAYLHVIIGYLATEVGESAEYVKLEYYKKAANKVLFISVDNDKITGQPTDRVRSSADLSVEEMTLSIDRFRDWSSQVAGIYLPESHEKEFLLEIEREMQKERQYL